MKRLFFMVASLVGVPVGVQAQEENIAVAPVPSWATLPDLMAVPEQVRGPVFFRRQVSEIHLDRNGQSSWQDLLARRDASCLICPWPNTGYALPLAFAAFDHRQRVGELALVSRVRAECH